MRNAIRALALGAALTLAPACASIGAPQLANPVTAAQTNDQRAYAVIESYGTLIETATTIVRDQSVPIEVKRALGRAEAAATPSVQTLEIAFSSYLRARAAYEAASRSDDNSITRAITALNAAGQALGQAIDRAQAPIAELQALISQHNGVTR